MRFTAKRALSALAIIVTAAATVTACSPGGAANDPPNTSSPGASSGALGNAEQTAAFNKLYEATKKAGENQVVIYGPSDSAEFYKTFEDRFPGIKVVVQQLQGAERDARLQAEASSGNYAGDLAVDGSTPIAVLGNSGKCQAFSPIMNVDKEWLPLDGKVAFVRVSIFGMVYNTNMLKKSDLPQTWEDLLDPKWKGKVTMVSPAAGGVTAYAFAQMLTPDSQAEKYGMSFMEKLKAQDFKYVAKDPLAPQAVATGDSPLAILVFRPFYTQIEDKGAPIDYAFPLKADNMWTRSAVCELKNAPHPEATKLYMNWLYSPEGQEAIVKAGSYPVMPGIAGPGGLPPIDNVSLMYQLPLIEGLTDYNEAIKKVIGFFGS